MPTKPTARPMRSPASSRGLPTAKRCWSRWDKFFDGLTALYAGAVYGTTEGRPHELSYARCLKFLLLGQGFNSSKEPAGMQKCGVRTA